MRGLRFLLVLSLGAALPLAMAPPAFAAAGPSAELTPNGPPAVLTFSSGGQTGKVKVMGLAGQQLSVATSKSTFANQCDLQLTLRAPDSSVVAGPVCAARKTNVSVASLPADGTYTASLVAGPAATGGITVAAKSTGDPGSITPHAAPLKVTWPVQQNQDIRLGFTAGAGDIFSIVATGGGDDPCLLSLAILDSSEDQIAVIPCAGRGAFLRRFPMPADGTYFMRLLGYDSRPLYVQLFNNVDQVVPIATDGTPAPFDTPSPGQDARFTFSGTAGAQVSAILSSQWAPFSQLLLYNPEGTLIRASQEMGFFDAFTLNETGTWSFLVDRQNREPDSGTLRVFAFADITGAADLSGAPRDVTLVPGQRAIYSFSGTAGQKISALLTKIKPGPCGALKQLLTLVRPDESIAADSTCFNKNKFLDATTLDVSGTWKVVVDPPGPPAEKAMLQIFDVADQTGTVATDGTPSAITISEPGQNARLSFTAPNAHQTVTVSISNATPPSCALQLIKIGTGAVGQASCSLGSATIGPMVIGTGSYEVLFDPQGPATGTASLKVTFGA